MIKKFLCRVKVQKEESCQLQEFSKNALKAGQKPFLWFGEPRAAPGNGRSGSSGCSGARCAPDTLAKEKESGKAPHIVSQLGFSKLTLTLLFLGLCLLSLIIFCLGTDFQSYLDL